MLIQALVNGVVLGALFALLGMGLTLVYGVMEVPNFAQAGVITVASYVMVWLHGRWPFWGAVAVGVAAACALSVATERLAYRFVRSRPLAAPAVALGLLLVLDNAALEIWGGDHRSLSPPYAGALLRLGQVTLPWVSVAVVLTASVAVLGLQLLLRRTATGRAIRAVSQNPEAARLLGIGLERQYVIAFAVSGCLAGLAAFAYAPTYAVSPYMADDVILDGFVVVILGGLGNVVGALCGGLLLGIVESLGAVYVSASYQTALGFAVLLLVITLRPSGLFATAGRRVG